jgi:uncharacterized RDD family membrane protein YckC
MTKNEFLTELENSLHSKISSEDINEILSDYSDIFENGKNSGKSDHEISNEIGSPANISRNILDDMKRNDKAPGIKSNTLNLASMARRLAAYLIDGISIIVIIPAIVLILNYLKYYPFGIMVSFIYLLYIILVFGVFNLITAFELWIFKGFTLGKWILKIRVISLNGRKINFWDAFLRDALIKGCGNLFTGGLLNIGSFIWGCTSAEHKTVHDLAAKTSVVNVVR